MRTVPTLQRIFDKRPAQWGLRGDPHLWSEMAQALSDSIWPASDQLFRQLLEAEFERLTGFPVSHATSVFVGKYDNGGMSSGQVSPAFWREQAIPQLLERYRAFCS